MATLGEVCERCAGSREQGLAWLIRAKTIVGDDWITQHLDMGHRSNVSRAVSAF